ncbi:MAG: hypothetical protein RBR24_00365 [Candidatus Carbobacillus sp.]|nr:hypothetical protein [Candidatus Carbobacillus sp.]
MSLLLLVLFISLMVIYALWIRTERRLKVLTEKVSVLENTLGQTVVLLQSFEHLEKMIAEMMDALSASSQEPKILNDDIRKKRKDDTLTSEQAPWMHDDAPTKSHQKDTVHARIDQLEGWQKEVFVRWQRGETASNIARALGRGTGEVTLLIEMIQRRT